MPPTSEQAFSNTPTSSCPDESSLLEFLAESAGAKADAVLEHLGDCADCRTVIAVGSGTRGASLADEEPLANAPAQTDRYHLNEVVGAGATAMVYRAFDRVLEREVAIKQVRTQVTDPQRLLQESRVMAKLANPNIVSVYDVELTRHGVTIVMEFIRGETLEKWLANNPSWSEIRDIFADAARGLAAAHAAGIVHRDFKPTNVLVGEDGRARVTDFGLACEGSGPGTASDLLATASSTGGTPIFMAPERLRGDSATVASDQYAYCVALYRAICSSYPLVSDDLSAMARLRELTPVPALKPTVARVPRRAQRAIARGLDANPENRWPTMAALGKELVVHRRRRWLVAATVLVAMGLALFFLVAKGQSRAVYSAQLCEETESHADRLWNEERKSQLVPAAPSASQQALRATALIDNYMGSWRKRRGTLCGRDDGQNSELLVPQLLCLEQRLLQVEGLLDVLPELHGTQSAVDMAAALPDSASCEYASALPMKGQTGARLRELRVSLARAIASHQYGTPERSISAIEAVVREASALNDEQLAAQAMLEKGMIQSVCALPEQAANTLREAYLAAIRSGDDTTAVRAALGLRSLAQYLADPSADATWLDHAKALTARGRLSATLRASVLTAEGESFAIRGEIAEAEERYQAAMALLPPAQAGSVQVADLLVRIARNRSGLRVDGSQISLQLRALGIYTGIYGAEHWRNAHVLLDIGLGLTSLHGRSKASDELKKSLGVMALERAGEILKRWYHSRHPLLIGAVVAEGLVHSYGGRRDAAIAAHRRALEMARAIYPEEHPHVLNHLVSLSSVLQAYGSHREAAQMTSRALTFSRAQEEPILLSVHGDVLESLGNDTGALEYKKRALLVAKHPDLKRMLAAEISALSSTGGGPE